MNIYSAMTIYFYLDADPPAGQGSERLKNEIKVANTPRTDGEKPSRTRLSRWFQGGKNAG
jgi:hypothetical protein